MWEELQMKFKVKFLSLCALIVASMAIMASSAQAGWLVLESLNGNIIEAGQLSSEKDLGLQVLHSKIAGVAVLFECTAMSLINANVASGGKIAEGAQVKFSGCTTKLNGTVSAACEPAGGKEKGVILTNKGHAVVVLHELADKTKDNLLQILPDTGETFATIEMGEECSIGEKVPVIGKAFLKDCQNDLPTHLERHLLEPGPLTELWTISKTAEHVATLKGSEWFKVRINGLVKDWGLHV
jgi:hypothetical protein